MSQGMFRFLFVLIFFILVAGSSKLSKHPQEPQEPQVEETTEPSLWQSYITTTKEVDIVGTVNIPGTNGVWLCGNFYQNAVFSDSKSNSRSYTTLGWTFFLVRFDSQGVRKDLFVETTPTLTTLCNGLASGADGSIFFLASSEGDGKFTIGETSMEVEGQTGLLGKISEKSDRREINLKQLVKSEHNIRFKGFAIDVIGRNLITTIEYSHDLTIIPSDTRLESGLMIDFAVLLFENLGNGRVQVRSLAVARSEKMSATLRPSGLVVHRSGQSLHIAVSGHSVGRVVVRVSASTNIHLPTGGSFVAFFALRRGQQLKKARVFATTQDVGAMTFTSQGNRPGTVEFYYVATLTKKQETQMEVISFNLRDKNMFVRLLEKATDGLVKAKSLIVDDEKNLWIGGYTQNTLFVVKFDQSPTNEYKYEQVNEFNMPAPLLDSVADGGHLQLFSPEKDQPTRFLLSGTFSAHAKSLGFSTTTTFGAKLPVIDFDKLSKISKADEKNLEEKISDIVEDVLVTPNSDRKKKKGQGKRSSPLVDQIVTDGAKLAKSPADSKEAQKGNDDSIPELTPDLLELQKEIQYNLEHKNQKSTDTDNHKEKVNGKAKEKAAFADDLELKKKKHAKLNPKKEQNLNLNPKKEQNLKPKPLERFHEAIQAVNPPAHIVQQLPSQATKTAKTTVNKKLVYYLSAITTIIVFAIIYFNVGGIREILRTSLGFGRPSSAFSRLAN